MYALTIEPAHLNHQQRLLMEEDVLSLLDKMAAPIAGTLLLRAYPRRSSIKGSRLKGYSLTSRHVEETWQSFCQCLEKKCFPRNIRRAGRQILARGAYQLGHLSGQSNPHIHFIVERPDGVEDAAFRIALNAAWTRVLEIEPFAWGKLHLAETPPDSGWIKYSWRESYSLDVFRGRCDSHK